MTESYTWPGNNSPNSEFDEFDYDLAQIIHSMTNDAFVDLYRRNKGIAQTIRTCVYQWQIQWGEWRKFTEK